MVSLNSKPRMYEWVYLKSIQKIVISMKSIITEKYLILHSSKLAEWVPVMFFSTTQIECPVEICGLIKETKTIYSSRLRLMLD